MENQGFQRDEGLKIGKNPRQLRKSGYERLAQAMPFSYASPNAILLADTLCAFLVSVIRGAARFAHYTKSFTAR